MSDFAASQLLGRIAHVSTGRAKEIADHARAYLADREYYARIAKITIPCYVPTRLRPESVDAAQVAKYYREGRVANADRKASGVITRLYLLAEPNEIAPMNHRTPTSFAELPMTYSHNMRACEAYGCPSTL